MGQIKFLTDRNLGKLTKWLRMLGYDTVYYTGNIDRSFLREGVKEGRIALTRRRDMARRHFSGRMFIVHADKVPDQLSGVIDEFSLEFDTKRLFTLCLTCNEKLKDIPKADIKSRVPPYVFQTQNNFRICPQCQKIFWPGTHRNNALLYLKQHNLFHLP